MVDVEFSFGDDTDNTTESSRMSPVDNVGDKSPGGAPAANDGVSSFYLSSHSDDFA